MTAQLIQSLGLSMKQFDRLLLLLGRGVSQTELLDDTDRSGGNILILSQKGATKPSLPQRLQGTVSLTQQQPPPAGLANAIGIWVMGMLTARDDTVRHRGLSANILSASTPGSKNETQISHFVKKIAVFTRNRYL